ncbi:hypothetical protein GCM10010166_04680 [Couchioplanes caeruleus subsp. azureus]|nr:hypothetical protein GCM10010166_04680 [Couchioplanes caeruleus subsp. azureus]
MLTTIALAAGALAGLAAAAAPADPARLEAVTEIKDDEWPAKVEYRARRGDVVRVPLGVRSADDGPVRGLVAKLEIDAGLEFARRYRNCWYTANAGRGIAWCEFSVTLPAHGGLTITTPVAAVRPGTEPGAVATIAFRWQSRGWSDARGGLRRVAAYFAGPGEPVVRGDQGVLALGERTLPTADIRANGNFVRLTVTDGPPLTPAATPPASPGSPPPPSGPDPSATGGAAPAATGGAAGGAAGGEGLPVTGTPSATVVTTGGALLLLGLLAIRIVRRRMRFTA